MNAAATHSEDPWTAAEALAAALEQRDVASPGLPVIDVLVRTAPNSSRFWTEVAEELHRANQHYDALDCWNQGLRVQSSEDYVDREDMASTLWAVSNGDEYLAGEALKIFVEMERWQMVAYIRHRTGADREAVLQALESAVVGSRDELDWEDFAGIEEYENIWDWYSLANYYLEQDAPSDALRCFGEHIAKHPSNNHLLELISHNIQQYIHRRVSAGTKDA